MSDAIIAEYSGVLARPKFAFSMQAIQSLLETLRRNGELFEPTGFQIASPDPADTKFLHCALAAKAAFIVTGNSKDFPNAPYGSTHVVNAAEMVKQIMQDM